MADEKVETKVTEDPNEELSDTQKLDRAIAAGLKTSEEEPDVEEEPELEVKAEDDEEDENGEEDEDEEVKKESKADPETENALKLWKALQGKDGAAVLEGLAVRAGLIKKDGAVTKVSEAKFTERLKESLGPEWDFLADKLGPAFEAELERRVENVRKSHIELEVSLELKDAWATLSEETDGDAMRYQDKIDKLSNEFQMGPKTKIVDYLRNLYKIASSDAKESKKIEKTLKKIEANSSDRLPRSSEVGEKRVKRGTQLPSLDEAVQQAFQEQMRAS